MSRIKKLVTCFKQGDFEKYVAYPATEGDPAYLVNILR